MFPVAVLFELALELGWASDLQVGPHERDVVQVQGVVSQLDAAGDNLETMVLDIWELSVGRMTDLFDKVNLEDLEGSLAATSTLYSNDGIGSFKNVEEQIGG